MKKPIQQGEKSMKLLKIDDGRAYFKKNNGFEEIDSITKEDILLLLKMIYEEEVVEFDEIDEEYNRINIPSQKLVYEKLYEKLLELTEKKDDIISTVESEFKEAVAKYTVDNGEKCAGD